MDMLKSELDQMVKLTTDLLADIATSVEVTLKRDGLTIRQRTVSEGPSFLTRTLPMLGKAFDRAISRDEGQMDYVGFKVDRGYPRFLGCLFRRIFDRQGRLLDTAPPTVVQHVRQILYLWYKYELPYSPEQEADLEDRFIETDAALPDRVPTCPVLQGARDLIARVCADFSYEAISPRHGPGAVATRERSWEKWRFKRLYQSIERDFPFSEWYIPSLSYLARCKQPLEYLAVERAGTARAVFVPKDSRGPRLISCEPLEYQWIQQGVASELIYCINKSAITSGRVNFTHQQVNRRYAELGSAGGGWATLDMKDASDRVSYCLVDYLFGSSHVCSYLLNCRTESTVLPSGRLVHLKKFAPMGSALCFPVESLVFYALAVNVLIHHMGYRPEVAYSRVKVYGDDLICSLEDYEAIMQYFPYVGLMFNEDKCCTGGLFRESCGMDAFAGVDVTPVKIRTRLRPSKEPNGIISAVEYSNALAALGYRDASHALREFVESQLGRDAGLIPYKYIGDEPTSYLTFRGGYNLESSPDSVPQRWNVKLQRHEYLRLCVRSHVVKRELPDWERLFANIATNCSRTYRPYRNVDYACELFIHRFMFTPEEVVEKTLFPDRRRVTLIRRWCA